MLHGTRDENILTSGSNPVKKDDQFTKDRLITASPDTTLEQAEAILNKNKVEKLLLVDDKGHLTGLITIKDIDKQTQFPVLDVSLHRS